VVPTPLSFSLCGSPPPDLHPDWRNFFPTVGPALSQNFSSALRSPIVPTGDVVVDLALFRAAAPRQYFTLPSTGLCSTIFWSPRRLFRYRFCKPLPSRQTPYSAVYFFSHGGRFHFLFPDILFPAYISRPSNFFFGYTFTAILSLLFPHSSPPLHDIKNETVLSLHQQVFIPSRDERELSFSFFFLFFRRRPLVLFSFVASFIGT